MSVSVTPHPVDIEAPVEIVLYASENSNTPVPATSSWDGLRCLLVDGIDDDPAHREAPCTEATCGKDGPCPHKSGPAWSPVTLAPGATRGNGAVQTVNAFVLDADHLPDEEATVAYLGRIKARGLAYLAHSTHSHREHDQNFRVVLALSRPVPAAQWEVFRAKVLEHLGLDADRQTKDASRLYYLPSHPHDSDVWWADEGAGAALDVDAILGELTAPSPAKKQETGVKTPTQLTAPPPAIEPPVEVDFNECLDALARQRRRYSARGDRERYGILKRVLDGVPLATTGTRDATIHTAASILAFTLPPNTPPWVAVEILRRSIAAMGAELEPEGLDHWLDKARSSYERRHEARLTADAERAAVNARISQGLRALLPRVAEAKAKEDDPSFAPPEDEEEDPEAWLRELIVKPVKDASEEPQLVACEHNATLLLENLPEWSGHVRWNDLTKDIEVTGGPLRPQDRHTSVLDVAVSNWLHAKYGLHVKSNVIRGPILLVARRNPYDPIVEYLDRVRRKTFTPQIHRVLLDHANAQIVDRAGRPLEAHVERVTRKWFIGAAVRALRPGTQVDSVLVLEGKMGKGKTSFFRILGGEFFAQLKKQIDSKDSTMLLARSWVVELGELAGVRAVERESLNNEITTTVDHIRPPYGRSVEEFRRRCVFGGTTEDDDWLVSLKGSRRWWPVSVGEVDLTWLRAHRDELWAEAATYAYEALEILDREGDPEAIPEELRWWLSGDEEAFAHEVVSSRYESGTVEHAIRAWWFGLRPDKRPTHVTTQQVLELALKMTSFDRPNRGLVREVNEAMGNVGFVRLGAVAGVAGGRPVRTQGWQSTPELRDAAREAGAVLTLKEAGRGAA